MSTTTYLSQKKNTGSLSALIVAVLTLLALLLGWVLKTSVESQVKVEQHVGVTAQFPAGWMVERGLVTEKMVFNGNDPFDQALSYTVSLIPIAAGSPITDLVGLRNLERGQQLDSYRVLDQNAVLLMGKDAYKVHFAYVDPLEQGQIPRVIEGVDYYFLNQPKSMVVTLEEETSLFDDALPRFMKFLGTVTYNPGGAQ